MRYILFIISIFILTSCATIPKASLQLSDAIREQSSEMHQLNVDLVNMYYEQRSNEIDEYISGPYTTTMLNNVKAGLIQAGMYVDTIYLQTLPMVQQKIITKRDLMQAELEKERVSTIKLLNTNYNLHIINCIELHNLLESAVDIDEETELLMKTLDELTKNKLNLQELDETMNNVLIEAGKISKEIESGGKEADKVINQAQEFINKNKKDD